MGAVSLLCAPAARVKTISASIVNAKKVGMVMEKIVYQTVRNFETGHQTMNTPKRPLRNDHPRPGDR